MSMALTKAETSELQKLETVIRDGLQSFVDCGNALLEIREKRLYRAGWSTFEEYCREKWRFSKTHANRLICGAQAAINLGHLEIKPANEAQARPLTALPAAQQGVVWQKVIEQTGGRPTAEAVREAVADVMRPAEKPAPSISRNVTFVNRVRVIHAFAVWSEKQGLPKKTAEQVIAWLRENL